jgi:hypothetical protein
VKRNCGGDVAHIQDRLTGGSQEGGVGGQLLLPGLLAQLVDC